MAVIAEGAYWKKELILYVQGVTLTNWKKLEFKGNKHGNELM